MLTRTRLRWRKLLPNAPGYHLTRVLSKTGAGVKRSEDGGISRPRVVSLVGNLGEAGGPRYLHRFATRATLLGTIAAGGNATLLSLREKG